MRPGSRVSRILAQVQTESPPEGVDEAEPATLISELGATPIDCQREDFTRGVPGGFGSVGNDGWAQCP